MRIATWNMDYWKRSTALREQAWEFLRTRIRPDIALVQEAVPALDRDQVVFRTGGMWDERSSPPTDRGWGSAVVSFGPLLRTFPGSVAIAEVVGENPLIVVSAYGVRRRTGEITTIDFPGAVFTVTAGINDQSDIVGQYSSEEDPEVRHGFLLRKGKFTTFDPEGSNFTNGLGINELGDITGRFFLAEGDDGSAHGFRLHRGSFTVVNVPGAVATNVWRSNNLGKMVGGYIDANDRQRAFVASGHDFKTLRGPRCNPISMDNGDINSRGDVLASFCDGEECATSHGVLFTDDGRKHTVIDVPGAASTTAFGMNELGDIVGFYTDTDGVNHAFLMPRRVPIATGRR